MPLAFVTAASLDWGTKGFAFALEQAHLPGLLIAGCLLVLSIVSWSVMASKMALMSRASQKNYRFAYAFKKTKEPLELHDKNASLPGAPLFSVYRAGARELVLQQEQTMADLGYSAGHQHHGMRAPKITLEQMEAVRSAMDRCIGEAVLTFENRMNMLATAVSGAPFLGLLGTVWGVMETFSGIASSSSTASIRDMAPGVAAALVTTVVGLLVAIPAMFGYNFLVSRIRTTTLEMHNFASELASLFERNYVDFRASQPAAAPVSAPSHSPASHTSVSQGPIASGGYYHAPSPSSMEVTAPVPVAQTPFSQQPYYQEPAPAPTELTAPVPLQVTAPIPLPRPQEPHFQTGPSAADPDSLWPPGGQGAPINPIAQQAAYQSQREREVGEHERQRSRQPSQRPSPPVYRPGRSSS